MSQLLTSQDNGTFHKKGAVSWPTQNCCLS